MKSSNCQQQWIIEKFCLVWPIMLISAVALMLNSCAPEKKPTPPEIKGPVVRLQPSDYPRFDDDMLYDGLSHGVRKTLAYLKQRPPDYRYHFGEDSFTAAHLIGTLEHFLDEYEAHIYEKRCPAKICKSLIRIEIIDGLCTGCTLCARNCPVNAISGERRQTHVIDPDICIKCGICEQLCPYDAIEIK